MGQMSSNFEEKGKARQRATQATPPPTLRLDLATLTRGGKRQIESPSAKSGRPNETPEWGENSAFLK